MTSKEAEIEELREVRDNEVVLMSTKRDTKIVEAQSKGDKKTLKELIKIKNRKLGKSAAKAVEAGTAQRRHNDGRPVRRREGCT